MPRKTDKICETPDCDDTVVASGLCSACYSWAYYHKRKSVHENQQYKKRQRRVAARIEQLMPDRKITKTAPRKYSEARAYN